MIKNELTVVQGFGCLNKVFDVKEDEVITYGMLLALDSGQAIVNVTDADALFIAQNTVANTDSAAYANSFNLTADADGNAVEGQVTCYPISAPIEIEVPATLLAGTLTAASDIGTVVYADAEKYSDLDSGSAARIGIVSGVSEDGLVTVLVGA